MRRRLTALWKKLKVLEPGERFQTLYREQRSKPLAMKVLFFAAAIACFAAGVVFAFIPGPAIVFFALSGALLATHFLWVARALDASEVWARKTLDSIRERRRRRRARAGSTRS